MRSEYHILDTKYDFDRSIIKLCRTNAPVIGKKPNSDPDMAKHRQLNHRRNQDPAQSYRCRLLIGFYDTVLAMIAIVLFLR